MRKDGFGGLVGESPRIYVARRWICEITEGGPVPENAERHVVCVICRRQLVMDGGAIGLHQRHRLVVAESKVDKDLAVDEFLDAIHPDKLVSFIALAPADPAAGVADAPDVTFLAVTGAVCEAIVIVKWVTEAADSPLIAYIDSATGLPVTPNTGDIQITWDSGANKIFKL